MPPPKY